MTTSPPGLQSAMPVAPDPHAAPSAVVTASTNPRGVTRFLGWAENAFWVAGAIVLLPVVILLVGAPIALAVRLVMLAVQGG